MIRLPENPSGEITQLLQEHSRGAADATDRLFELVYDDLKRIAHGQLWSRDATLQTTALVHESWFKLEREGSVQWESRGHFFAIAARAMRQVVIDHARARAAAKRGGGRPAEPLSEEETTLEAGCSAVLALQAALEELSQIEPRLVQVVDCRFFAGLTFAEAGEALGVSSKTVQRDWLRARLLLRELMGEAAATLSSPGSSSGKGPAPSAGEKC